MSKSTEKVKKKYADTYKWTDDEVELLLTVTKEYKTKQIAKIIDWESCVDKYGEILEGFSVHYRIPRRKMLLLLAKIFHTRRMS